MGSPDQKNKIITAVINPCRSVVAAATTATGSSGPCGEAVRAVGLHHVARFVGKAFDNDGVFRAVK
ncbi:MAG: hypothetical protein ACOWWO_06460 [Peptococcaceae bacterium]